MRICFVTVGRFKSEFCEALVQKYLKLAQKFATLETVELTLAKNLPEQQAQDQALLKLLEKRGSRTFLTLLDEKGRTFTSQEFAARVEKIRDGSYTEWIIAAGGAHGYGTEVQSHASLLWSLSPLTMAHELAASVAAEQVFRGLSILAGHPYHNG